MNQLIDTALLRRWATENAKPLPPDGSAQPLDDVVGDAVVVGLGESTRASREILAIGHHVFRYLVEHKGFRALALSDDASVIAELDVYVRTGAGDVPAILANAFVAWRISELVDIVEWLRSYNAQHPHDPVRMFGLEPASVRVAEYDEVLDQLRHWAPQLLAEVETRYATIRTAHHRPEHVQLAHGTHPGQPFKRLAREAHDLIATLGDHPAVDTALRIAEYHENTIAAGKTFGHQFRDAAQAIIDWRQTTGHKIMFWEGIAHVARAASMGFAKMSGFSDTTGNRLRQHFADGYVTVAIGFDHGLIHAGVEVPSPPADYADAVLGAAEPDVYLLDLRGPHPQPVADWLDGDHKLRIIAGVYKAEEDADHHVTGGPLDEWFDAVVRVRTINPTTML